MFLLPNLLLNRRRGFVVFLFLTLVLPTTAIAAPKDQSRWDKHYDIEEFLFGTEPIHFLKENINLLPKGKALDLAMGEGRNGVYLATQGFDVLGLDISPLGLKKAHKKSKSSL